MSKTQKAIQAARERLRMAIDRACIARGEAQWTMGYRTAVYAVKRADGNAEVDRLYEKARRQFQHCVTTEATAERAIRAYGLSIRRLYDPIRRRGKKKAR